MEPEKPGFSQPNAELPDPPGTESQRPYIPAPPKRKKSIAGRVLKVFVIVLMLAAVGGGIYLFLTQKKDAPAPPPPSPPAETQQQATSKHFASADPDLKLQFDYPSDWAVEVTEDKRITVTTSAQELTTAGGSTVNATAIIQFRNKRVPLNDLSGNNVTAAQSEKLAYSQPTTSQRTETYLSFIQGETPGSIAQIFITGDKNFKKGVPILATDLAEVDPIIDIVFYDGITPIEIDPTAWKSSALADDIRALLRSLIIS